LTDGSRDENGAVGTRWCGRRDRTGPGGRPIRRVRSPSCSGTGEATQARQSRIFTRDHAITRMTHDEPDLRPSGKEGDSSPARAGAFCRDRDPLVPRAQRDPREKIADGWAKQAATEPDDHGVEWLTLSNGDRLPSRPTSLAHLKRRYRRRSGRKPGRGANRDDSTRGTSSGRKAARPDSNQGGEADGLEVLPAQVRACTWRARITDRTTTAEGATQRTTVVLTRRETTSPSTVTSGKTNRPRCGRGSRTRRSRGSRSGAWATYWMRGAARQY